MSAGDKIENKVQELVGKAKEKIGDATGNDELRRAGLADQAEAGVKQPGEKVKDGLSEAKAAITDVFKKKS